MNESIKESEDEIKNEGISIIKNNETEGSSLSINEKIDDDDIREGASINENEVKGNSESILISEKDEVKESDEIEQNISISENEGSILITKDEGTEDILINKKDKSKEIKNKGSISVIKNEITEIEDIEGSTSVNKNNEANESFEVEGIPVIKV